MNEMYPDSRVMTTARKAIATCALQKFTTRILYDQLAALLTSGNERRAVDWSRTAAVAGD